jgi:uncharacterized MAPEG superfamily protein
MTVPMWCLLAGLFLPYIWAGASIPFRLKQFGNVGLSRPREQGNQLTEAGHGAWGAQANAWEALAVFTVANLIAFMVGLDPAGNWSLAAMIWVIARLFHGIFYIANIPVLRVFCFVGGVAMSLWIIFMAATA